MSESWYDVNDGGEARDKINKLADINVSSLGIFGDPRYLKIDHDKLSREKPETVRAIKNIVDMYKS